MTGKQKAVLWLGLILVGLNLAMRWSEIRDVIFGGAGLAPSGTTTTPPVQGGQNTSPNSGNIQVPIDPFLPVGPKITIPIPKLF